MAEIRDLWPDDIGMSDTKLPVAILREQADILSRKTGNMITGNVNTITTEQGNFRHDFDVGTPALGQYRYTLFYVIHDITLYPVRIVVTNDDPITMLLRAQGCSDQKKFEEALRDIFASEETRRVMQALLAHSKAS